ncbi:MAG: WYL domain-containing protein [Lachnospiraceae bacterium]|nr:WYL domain-containing protein [Lachnospiraceae bacterium]
MIFHEIYGCYYNAVARLIRLAIDGELTEEKIYTIASESAYGESFLTISEAIRSQEWQLIDANLQTPILNPPKMPLTVLEKRWLKTILTDKRAGLFSIPKQGLEDVEPLFTPEDIVHFDRYLDGDDYTSPDYIRIFRTALSAVKEHKKIRVSFVSGAGRKRSGIFLPTQIEYSDKEDKFRILCVGNREIRSINIGRILSCEKLEDCVSGGPQILKRKKERLVLELTDEKSALERAMMKFAHFKKEVERLDEHTYRVELEYDKEDETDVLIQVMSFGRFVKVLEPEAFKKNLCDRISRQLSILEW